jgi:hypothetical protein
VPTINPTTNTPVSTTSTSSRLLIPPTSKQHHHKHQPSQLNHPHILPNIHDIATFHVMLSPGISTATIPLNTVPAITTTLYTTTPPPSVSPSQPS